jgi:V/A-type H+-transporting ATPase subunit A
VSGIITGIAGPTVTVDLKGLRLYEIVLVGKAGLTGEVVRLERERAILQVYEEARGLAIGEEVRGTGRTLTAQLGPGLLGGMFDGLQRPLATLLERDGPFIAAGSSASLLDNPRQWHFMPSKKPGDEVSAGECLGEIEEGAFRHLVSAPHAGLLATLAAGDYELSQPVGSYADASLISICQQWPVRLPRPYRRKLAPDTPLVTGQRVIDFLYPLARGGTAIIPGGFGTGKTVLEQTIAKFADTDVVVYVGCGERGNEMAGLLAEFGELSDARGRPLLERTIVVANTSNMPVAARESSIFTAVSMAEYYRDMGYDVLFLADSLSRWAEALREISSALEEMPGEEGYPTYLGSRLASFIERAGVVETRDGQTGSLSMLLAVSPPGADFSEPVTQSCLRVAGAYYMLDTTLAHGRHFPAINWVQSYSLAGPKAADFFKEQVDERWPELQRRCRDILQQEEALREVAEVVGMEGLQDRDRLLMKAAERIRRDFLRQNSFTEDAFSSPEQTFGTIDAIVADYQQALAERDEKERADDAEQGGGDAPG